MTTEAERNLLCHLRSAYVDLRAAKARDLDRLITTEASLLLDLELDVLRLEIERLNLLIAQRGEGDGD